MPSLELRTNSKIPRKLKIINDDLTKPWNKKYSETCFANEVSPKNTYTTISP